MALTHLDLFSGIGGFAMAAQRAGFTTVGFSEIEPYACKILKRHWPTVPNYGDIKNITRETMADAQSRQSGQQETWNWREGALGGSQEAGRTGGNITLITGGFPCQPFSTAGKRGGAADDRALWPEMRRVIAAARPAFVLGENVPGIVSMELDSVLDDLGKLGYSARAIAVPACAVDARHRRQRIWIMAYADGRQHERGFPQSNQRSLQGGDGKENGPVADTKSIRSGSRLREVGQEQNGHQPSNSGEYVPDALGVGFQRQRPSGEQISGVHEPETVSLRDSSHQAIWPVEPGMGRVVDGVPNRAHRLRGLGNAIVPQVAEMILKEMARLAMK